MAAIGSAVRKTFYLKLCLFPLPLTKSKVAGQKIKDGNKND
ncbi:hypothetical protein ACOSZF_22310 [Cytobacillus firmus]|uniref:Uncharacterized protein n=1 Tax=Cytobacillus firmus TaxID=1399 RepID=A0A380XBZ0_CYTFI|nr:hypothetical protein [Cytobacillus firmus]KAF0821592.1 hypothetical protein KIS1582_4658 [Cytobacillus firmus]MEC1893577.1 hypothetical protein [Cytobacillus firmus]MED1906803.1 hypothetical protein [Cytobacillus firmus]MED1943037.1 hypothetical protein [Cytobacillus firmus]MED4450284.1 hypothetical protein [Cytobacillus firmus]